jgi:adenosylcobinamide-GDP ribazoletransferase
MFRSLLIAGQFLTILPLRVAGEIGKAEIGRSAAAYPIIGLVLGLLLLGAMVVLRVTFAPRLAEALLVALWAGLTGGMHLDGLADTLDGLAFGRSRDEVLRIMKDTRLGSYGAVGLAAVLLVKLTALGAVPAARVGEAVVLALVLGRTAAVHAGYLTRYAGLGEGMARTLTEEMRPVHWLAALAIAAGLAVLVGRARGGVALAAMLAVSSLLAWFFVRRIGGVTGDVYGATIEVNEAVALLVFAAAPGGLG